MSASGGRRALRLLVLAIAMIGIAVPAEAQAPQSGGRKGNEFRVPLRRGVERRIPVILVAPGEVGRPVVGASRAPASVTPSFGGGMNRPPMNTGGSAGGNSLFEQLVTPQGAGRTASAPPAAPGLDPYRDSGGATAAGRAPMQTAPQRGVARSQSRRPTVRVINGGSGRIQVLPSSSDPAVAAGASGVMPSGGEYRIGPGDVLDVFVWRNEELSRQVPVRPDGLISLPLVGEIRAAGMSAESLQAELAVLLSDYVQQPTVTVTVAEIKSLVVYVIGNVNSPGTVTMDRNLTVLQAIAMAGGLNEFAGRNDIVVMRTDAAGNQRRLAFRYGDVVAGKDLGTNLLLQAGDVIYVP